MFYTPIPGERDKGKEETMRICRLDGQKMRRKSLLTFARIMVYDI